jgi:dipeptidyl aminopeptidase/acylaminoacyl peptidase
MNVIRAALLVVSGPVSTARWHARPFDVEDLVRLARVSDPVAFAGRARVAYVLRETDIDGDRGVTACGWCQRWAFGAAAPDRRRVSNASSRRAGRPRATRCLFLSDRSGSNQVWRSLEGGEARQVTSFPVPVRTFVVSPAGDRLVVSLSVFTDCEDLDCTRSAWMKRAQRRPPACCTSGCSCGTGTAGKTAGGRSCSSSSWTQGRAGAPRLLSRGSTGRPDAALRRRQRDRLQPGRRDSRVRGPAVRAGEPWSTNVDLWSVAVAGEAAPENLTPDNEATDTTPVFSPDGRYLAWLAMSRPGFEADRYRILLRDLRGGTTREVAPDWDRSAHGLAFSPGTDGRCTPGPTTSAIGACSRWTCAGGRCARASAATAASAASAGPAAWCSRAQNLAEPRRSCTASTLRGGGERQLTRHNSARLEELEFGAYEQFSFEGAGGATVYGWVVKPVGLRAGRATRWRSSSTAARRAAWATLPLPLEPADLRGPGLRGGVHRLPRLHRLRPGVHRRISGDWGGKPLEDLQKGWAAAQEQFRLPRRRARLRAGRQLRRLHDQLDRRRLARRLRCLVNHCGVFDNRSMYYSTEELWFPEWEMGGPQFENPEGYERHNPVNLVAEWRTPMLVIHGANDYRVPLEQGLATFTALQRRASPASSCISRTRTTGC